MSNLKFGNLVRRRLRACQTVGSMVCSRSYSASDTPKYGQPTPWTHRHLLKSEDEVNVGVSRAEFQKRRENLAESIVKTGRKEKRCLVIVPSARKQYMVDHIPYFFRQDTDFRYLTGCLQPDSVLVLEVWSEGFRSHMFIKESSAYEEKWEGVRFGLSEALHFFGVDKVNPLQHFEDFLYRFSVDNKHLEIWYDMLEPRDLGLHKTIKSFFSSLSPGLQGLEPLRPVLHELRSVKSTSEISLMRKTCQIGAEALKKTISKAQSLRTELDYLATVDYESRIQGACHLAYPPVVASGDNATVIHYIAATGAADPGDLVLMDAGCEYHGYSSDITRTWPQSGECTDAQRTLYDIVLDCQNQLVSTVQPGISIDQLYRNMQLILSKSLRSAGLVSGDDATVLRLAHLFCPHNVGHHLGMDVHDCGSVSKSRPLVPGNVITIEPGIYISKNNPSVPKEFRGIGIRIEDDILVNQSGCEVLTHQCPKSLPELENLIRNSR